MRYFDLLNVQHYVLYLLPTLVTIVIFTFGLGFTYLRRKGSEERETRIIEEYPGGIQGRDAPFPLILILIVAGTVVWALAYFLMIGLLEVKI